MKLCGIATVTYSYLNINITSYLHRFFANVYLVLSPPKGMLSLLSTNQNRKHSNKFWVLCHQLLWHLRASSSIYLVSTQHKHRLRKRTIYNLHSGTCHLHIVRTIKALKIDLCGTPHLMSATLEYIPYFWYWL